MLQYWCWSSWLLRSGEFIFKRSCQNISVDHWPNRLNLTKDLGAEIINFDNEDLVDVIKKRQREKE